jgi:hypothetical protein
MRLAPGPPKGKSPGNPAMLGDNHGTAPLATDGEDG